MSKFRLDIEYEGTRYNGWQKQPGQENSKTIQGTLLKIADQIFQGRPVELQGSGRTDKGVHALCQTAHLEVDTHYQPEQIRLKFNDLLPADINIIKIDKAGERFHARHNAVARSYVYQISMKRTAFLKPFVWWIKDKLDVAKMVDAAKVFEGMNDFSSFSELEAKKKSTLVEVQSISVTRQNDLLLIHIRGSHFLWKMVRRIVGCLVEVGRGNMTKEDLRNFLKIVTNVPAKFTAPPSGLFLEKVYYDKDSITNETNPAIYYSGKL